MIHTVGQATIHEGDSLEVLQTMKDESVQCVVTSPPYWGLRNYGVDGQLGLEESPAEFVDNLVSVFREVRRVLREDGTLWLNLGDCYAGSGCGGASLETSTLAGGLASQNASKGGVHRAKPSNKKVHGLKIKDLVGMPWRVAFALQEDGWWLRSDIIWSKTNAMPESVTDRPTKAHEYLFLLSKSSRYFYDSEAVKELAEKGNAGSSFTCGKTSIHQEGRASKLPRGDSAYRNIRSVWTVPTQPYPGAHFATFPPKLIEPCIKAGSRVGDTVLDPFSGAGTTGLVSLRLDRHYVGIELNPEYIELSKKRIQGDAAAMQVSLPLQQQEISHETQ